MPSTCILVSIIDKGTRLLEVSEVWFFKLKGLINYRKSKQGYLNADVSNSIEILYFSIYFVKINNKAFKKVFQKALIYL